MMPVVTLIYITGLSGAGKSAVVRELGRRGHEAHGVDEEGYADWIDCASGLVAPYPHDDPDLDVHAWFATHHWVLAPDRVARLAELAAGRAEPVFLAGVADGEDAVR